MSKEYPCIESTIEFKYLSPQGYDQDFLLRLWIDQSNLQNYYKESFEIKQNILDYMRGRSHNTPEAIIDFVAKNIKRVNAIQVKDKDNFGVVAYLVDF